RVRRTMQSTQAEAERRSSDEDGFTGARDARKLSHHLADNACSDNRHDIPARDPRARDRDLRDGRDRKPGSIGVFDVPRYGYSLALVDKRVLGVRSLERNA